MTPDDVYRLVRYIDKHKDGRIRFLDFETSLTMYDSEIPEITRPENVENEFKNIVVQPKPIQELYVNKDKERIEKREAISMQVFQVECSRWTEDCRR